MTEKLAEELEKELENNKELDAQDYFSYVKNMKEKMTDEFLDNLHKVVTKQLSKALITGQNLQVRRLAYSLGIIKREHELIKQGIDVYVLRENIEEFINNVADKVVKVIDLEFYPREIPDAIFEKVKELKEKNIFDNYYVIYTDYTGEAEKQIKKERIRKDPILFGTFENKIDNIWNICDRFYFIGDWEDEYCDLTLTKMVQKMSEKGIDIVNNLAIPEVTEDEVRQYVNKLDETEEADRFRQLHRPKTKSFFQKVRTAWKVLTEN